MSTIQVPEKDAREILLPAYKKQLADLLVRVAEVKASIEGIEGKSPARKRGAKYGEAPQKVIDYMRAHPEGAIIRKIAKECGASYGTTWRTIKNLAEDDKAVEKEGNWTLKD